ncbi:unnamed protein product [Paramecium sonneborni]|uniref:Uncharacterized protein n=1 Tax=Paramecium sonneborni TaxID=65129 RepID=A0A8S1NKA5_9CILI|nr:unnamed protein product [Paramecium sonneborni]
MYKSNCQKELCPQKIIQHQYIMKEDFMNCMIFNNKKLLQLENSQRKYDFFQKYIQSFFQFQTTRVVIFHDPSDLKIKLLDLNTNKINPNFVFQSSEKVNIKSDKQSREIIVDKYRLFFLDCEEKSIKYLISQDLEKYYSDNYVCHFTIRILPLYYTPETLFNLEIVIKYDYSNSNAQIELFYWQIDKETIAVYGQDNEQNQSEILLIKPHLLEKAFYIVPTKYQSSYTIMNVTNWINPHQVAIWTNCNDETTRPSIFTFDLRNYYDGQNWLPGPESKLILVLDEYVEQEPAIFMDIYQFNFGSTYVLQIRQIGDNSKISLINYQNIQKPEIVDAFILNSFWIHSAVDHSYIIHFNDLQVEDSTVNFKVISPVENNKLQNKNEFNEII